MDNSDFFSLDRLLEFGMGMSMAQQMIGMMNQSMRSMYIPGSAQTIPPPQSQIYYVALDGKAVGPLNESELLQMISRKIVNKDTLAWIPGMSAWQPIEKTPEILKVVALTPPQLP